MRCRKCYSRFTLKRPPERYARPVKCPVCRTTNVRSDELNRRREMQRQDTCRCTGYPFPHRAGSMTYCHGNPKWDDPAFTPTELDNEAYDRVIATPRSAMA